MAIGSRRAAGAALVAFALASVHAPPSAAQPVAERANRGLVEIVAGGTDLRMLEELAALLDDGGARRILPVVGKGALQNVIDLRVLRGIDMAIVPMDVLADLRERKLYPGLENRLSYITRMYNEEFHLLAGAGIETVRDLAGKKVNVGVPGDGTGTTAHAVFAVLNVPVVPTNETPREALAKLKTGEIAAIAVVGAKPVPLFAGLRHDGRLHFVAIPPDRRLLGFYAPEQLTAEEYPELLEPQQLIDTVAVPTVLMAANFAPEAERYRNLATFVDAFFTQLPRLAEGERNPKWQEVDLNADLPGWRRFPPAEAWLKRNAVAAAGPSEQQMREIFSRFIDERGRATGRPISAQQKDELFAEFKRWVRGQAQ
jgi:TRAP-type uncharacterized transport system substrate-binding protein